MHESPPFFCRGEDIVLGYGNTALTERPFSFSLPQGSLTALVGPNGSGKTTLLKAVLGENVLLSGSVCLFDSPTTVRRMSARQLARTVAFVPQEHVYPLDCTLSHLLGLAYLPRMGLFGKPPLESGDEIDGVLSFFSLNGLRARPLKNLSTGERQKAFLGRALLQRPRLLILDEPTNHLDPGAIYAFWDLLRKRQRDLGLDVLISTHDMTFVRQHCQWICALKNGNLFFNGSSEDFWKKENVLELFDIPRDSPRLPFGPFQSEILHD